MKGGARTRSGPSPAPDALRRSRDAATWTTLDGKGCTADVPEWPQEVADPTVAELAMWQRLWATPQAIVWHADGVADTVALYVRTYLEAAKPDASGAVRTFVRQLQEQLLLSIPALHAARYVIDTPLTDAQQGLADPSEPERPAATGTDGSSVRSRFTVVRDPSED